MAEKVRLENERRGYPGERRIVRWIAGLPHWMRAACFRNAAKTKTYAKIYRPLSCEKRALYEIVRC